MTPRRMLSLGVEIIAIILIASLIAGQVLGYPVLVGFVETGSMAPTLNPGDGFIAVPTAVAGEISENDVVVFRAQQIQGGGLTTHRIVDEAERGYITRGDANPFTDQDGDEPPVREEQIVAKLFQPAGSCCHSSTWDSRDRNTRTNYYCSTTVSINSRDPVTAGNTRTNIHCFCVFGTSLCI